MAKAKQAGDESVAGKAGRALVDIPAHQLKSGDYATLPAEVADALEGIGAFDTKAKAEIDA
jgi:hypothetical protein